MSKLLKIFRSQKRRSVSTSSSRVVKNKTNAIFRSKPSKNTTNKKTASAPPVIEAAITYSLSEDEESCNVLVSPDVDIENQLSTDELKGEYIVENVAFPHPTGTDDDARNETTDVEQEDRVKSNENGSCKTMSENDKTLTFTHVEIMRNELAHIMQIANKDKEICELKQAAEDMKLQHTHALESKDDEIAKINKIVVDMGSAVSLEGDKLAFAEEEHSKTIAVLMETQYDYHELKTNSWFKPFVCYF